MLATEMITYIFGAWLCRTSNPYLKKIRDTCGDNLYENITVIGGSDATQPRFRRMLPYVVTRNTVNNILFFKLSMAHHKLLWNGFCVLPSRDCFLAIYCSLTALFLLPASIDDSRDSYRNFIPEPRMSITPETGERI